MAMLGVRKACETPRSSIPHIFVWGSCFWFCIPPAPPRPPPPPPPRLSHTTLSHTMCHTHLCQPPSFTHHLSHTHTQLCREPPSFAHNLSLTTLSPTIFHTQSFTHIFVNHHLFTHNFSHTSLSTTIFHTQLCQPPSFTHNFVTHHLSHTSMSPTIFHIHLCHPPSFTHIFVVWRGRRGAWQAWHLGHWAGSGGTLALDWSPVTPRHFAWQAWHLVTSAFVSRGRPGTWRHPPSFHVAGVALGDIHFRFAWQAWHFGRWAGSGGALVLDWSPVTPRHFAWQAWHLATSTFVSPGRRGAWWHPPSFHMAGVALGDIHLRFAWQACHFGRWAGSGGALVLDWSPVTPRHFAWQAWHLPATKTDLRQHSPEFWPTFQQRVRGTAAAMPMRKWPVSCRPRKLKSWPGPPEVLQSKGHQLAGRRNANPPSTQPHPLYCNNPKVHRSGKVGGCGTAWKQRLEPHSGACRHWSKPSAYN